MENNNLINVVLDNTHSKFLIIKVPLALQPQNVVAAAAGGGSLTAGKTYYYKITAIGYNGETIGSTEVSATTSAGNQTINLSWNAQSNAATTGIVTQWHVWRSLTSGVYTDGYFVVNNATSFSDHGTKTINTGTMGAGSPVNQPEITSIKYSSIERVITTFIPPFSDNGFDTRTSVTRLYLTDKCGKQIFECDLQRVYNQSGWNGGLQANCSQCESDINAVL